MDTATTARVPTADDIEFLAALAGMPLFLGDFMDGRFAVEIGAPDDPTANDATWFVFATDRHGRNVDGYPNSQWDLPSLRAACEWAAATIRRRVDTYTDGWPL